MEFTKNNVTEQWEWDLINEFPEFFLEISDEIMAYVDKWNHPGQDGDQNFQKINDLVNLRFGFEFGIGWVNVMRDHLSSIKKVIERAKFNGHEVFYKGFIMKSKFNTLRDQGVFSGKDRDIYIGDYYDLTEDLYKKSSVIDENTGEVII